MIKSIFKDTSIQIFLLEFIPIKITDPNIKQDIFKELHSSKISSHKGITKTLKRFNNIIHGTA